MKVRIASPSRLCAARRGAALAVLLTLAGCAGPAAKPALTSAASSTVTVSAQYALPADATVLGPVEGISCARSAFGAKATSKEATQRMKQNAARMGATGVRHMRVATLGVTPSCWYSFVATGTAYR